MIKRYVADVLFRLDGVFHEYNRRGRIATFVCQQNENAIWGEGWFA